MSANPMTKKMSHASDDVGHESPRRGDRFHCNGCGMSVEVTSDCRCAEGKHVHFHCCDQEMVKD